MDGLHVIHGPAYWEARARVKRDAWAADERARRHVVAEVRRLTRVRGSAKHVAHEFGVTVSTVSAVLHGHLAPTVAMMERLGPQRSSAPTNSTSHEGARNHG